jgi:hydroxymethylbilane synthase
MAMAQSAHVAGLLTARTGRRVELVGMTTFGDVSQAALAQIGGTGVFVSGLRERLLGGDIDFAVHSLKDLPSGQENGLGTASSPPPFPRPPGSGPARRGGPLSC